MRFKYSYSTIFLIIMIIAVVIFVIILIQKTNAAVNKLKNSDNVEAYEVFNKKIENTPIAQLYYENTIQPPIQFAKDIFAQL